MTLNQPAVVLWRTRKPLDGKVTYLQGYDTLTEALEACQDNHKGREPLKVWVLEFTEPDSYNLKPLPQLGE